MKRRASTKQLREYKKINLSYWTKWEKWFFEKYLKGRHRYRRQIILWRRICDFILPNKWIRIEIDWEHHNSKWYKEYDHERDKRLFERYWFITLRVKDYDDSQAVKVINFSKGITWSSKDRIKFIKQHIRWREIYEVDEELFDYEWKITVLYRKSLY